MEFSIEGKMTVMVVGYFLVGLAVVRCEGCTSIPRIVSNDPVLISSQGFPNTPYSSDTDDCWYFRNMDINGKLKITFKDFKTELCCDDVDIYDGMTYTARVLRSYSGTYYTERSTDTTGPNMIVHFTTDSSLSERGWQACICDPRYSCDCDWLDVSGSGSDNGYDGGLAGGLSLQVWIGIGVGITLLFSIPTIIGLSIACCACCAAKRGGRRNAATTNTAIAMATMDTTNLPPGTYPTQQNAAYPTQQTVAYTTVQGQAYAAQPNAQATMPGSNTPNPQIVIGVPPSTQPGGQGYAGTEGVKINMAMPPNYTASTSPPDYQ